MMRSSTSRPWATRNEENPPGAQFEILVDGKPQSYGDVKDVAIASAKLIKSHNRLVTWRSGTWRPARSRRLATSPASSDGPQDAPDRPWPRRLQGQHRLRRVLRGVVYRSNLRKPQRP